MPSCFVWTWGKQFSGGQALLQRSYTWRSLCLPATLDISQGVVGGEGVMARLAGMEGPEYELGHRTVEKELVQRESILGQVWAFRTRLNPRSVKGLSFLAGPPSCGSLKG